jgi:hypothetical protein
MQCSENIDYKIANLMQMPASDRHPKLQSKLERLLQKQGLRLKADGTIAPIISGPMDFSF